VRGRKTLWRVRRAGLGRKKPIPRIKMILIWGGGNKGSLDLGEVERGQGKGKFHKGMGKTLGGGGAWFRGNQRSSV